MFNSDSLGWSGKSQKGSLYIHFVWTVREDEITRAKIGMDRARSVLEEGAPRGTPPAMLSTDMCLTLKRYLDNLPSYIWITNESLYDAVALSAMSMRSSYPRNLTRASEQVIHSFANHATMTPSQRGKGIAIERPWARFLADGLDFDFLNSETTRGGKATNWLGNGDDPLNWLERHAIGFN
ncbi:hypothetical protein P0D73_07910 [Paraburkholderia sp. RL18-101-BIB-B]